MFYDIFKLAIINEHLLNLSFVVLIISLLDLIRTVSRFARKACGEGFFLDRAYFLKKTFGFL